MEAVFVNQAAILKLLQTWLCSKQKLSFSKGLDLVICVWLCTSL